MKKILFCLILIGIFTSCEQQNMNVSKKNVSHLDKNTALSKVQALCQKYVSDSDKIVVSRNSDQDIDWGKVILADGCAALTGMSLATPSYNLYTILASAVGFGVYYSIEEYDRQRADTMNYYPAIDPLNPIRSDWEYALIPINHENALLGSYVGYYHNLILSSLDANNVSLTTSVADLSTILQYYGSLSGDIFYDANYIISLFGSCGGPSYEYLNNDELPFISLYNTNIPFMDDSSRASFTCQFIDIVSNSALDNADAIICSIMTTYYSSFIWNRVIY